MAKKLNHFKCLTCPATFKRVKGLIEHQEKFKYHQILIDNTNDKLIRELLMSYKIFDKMPLMCKTCHQKCKDKYELFKHQSESSNHVGIIIDFDYIIEETAKSSEVLYHLPKICNICNSKFKNESECWKHTKEFITHLNFSIDYDTLIADSINSQDPNDHVHLNCTKCNKIFKNRSESWKHTQEHKDHSKFTILNYDDMILKAQNFPEPNDELPLICKICDFKCKNRVESWYHTKNSDAHNSFVLDYEQILIDDTYKKDSLYIETPDDSKPMSCTVCKFICKNRLDSLIHTQKFKHFNFSVINWYKLISDASKSLNPNDHLPHTCTVCHTLHKNLTEAYKHGKETITHYSFKLVNFDEIIEKSLKSLSIMDNLPQYCSECNFKCSNRSETWQHTKEDFKHQYFKIDYDLIFSTPSNDFIDSKKIHCKTCYKIFINFEEYLHHFIETAHEEFNLEFSNLDYWTYKQEKKKTDKCIVELSHTIQDNKNKHEEELTCQKNSYLQNELLLKTKIDSLELSLLNNLNLISSLQDSVNTLEHTNSCLNTKMKVYEKNLESKDEEILNLKYENSQIRKLNKKQSSESVEVINKYMQKINEHYHALNKKKQEIEVLNEEIKKLEINISINTLKNKEIYKSIKISSKKYLEVKYKKIIENKHNKFLSFIKNEKEKNLRLEIELKKWDSIGNKLIDKLNYYDNLISKYKEVHSCLTTDYITLINI